MYRLLQMLLEWLRPLRFDKYRPAARLRDRRVEQRLLRRLSLNIPDTAR